MFDHCSFPAAGLAYKKHQEVRQQVLAFLIVQRDSLFSPKLRELSKLARVVERDIAAGFGVVIFNLHYNARQNSAAKVPR